MNAGFEMIWCNFSSPSVRLISHLNITAPLLPEVKEDFLVKEKEDPSTTSYYPLPPSPTRSDRATDPANPARPPVGSARQWLREPFFRSQAWSWYSSATTHYGSNGDGPGRGETHLKINGCGFLSYYSPEFSSQAIPRARSEQKSLNLTKDGYWTGPGKAGSRHKALESFTRRRRYHTLEDVASSNALIMRTKSELVLRSLLSDSLTNCSGIDWPIMTNDIVQTYSSPLFRFLNTLESFENLTRTNATILRNWMIDIRDQSHSFLLPFLEYPDEDASEEIWSRDSSIFKATYSRCRFQFTRLLVLEKGISLGLEESLLKWSVEETTGGICSALVDVGLAVEGLWKARFNAPFKETLLFQIIHNIQKEVSRWTEGIEELMAWLGWAGEWVRCEQRCAWDESCFIPMWPLIPFPGRGPPRSGHRYGRYPYGHPGYGRHYPYDGFPPPGNATGIPPGRGFDPWTQSEDGLWSPQCVKSDYILKGGRR